MAVKDVALPGLFDQMLDQLLLVRGTGLLLVALAIGLLSYVMISRLKGSRQVSQEGTEIRGSALGSSAFAPHWLSPAKKYLLPADKKEQVSLSRRLLQAGYGHENAVLVYHGLKALLAVVLGLLFFLLHPWMPGALPEYPGMVMMIDAAIGLILPSKVLDSLRQRRQQQFIAGLPQMLDMLLICLSAGLNLTISIGRLQQELKLAHPLVAEEMGRVSAELNAGVSLEVALHEFSDRTGLQEVHGLVGILIEANRYGANLSDILRDYIQDFRAIRLHRADLQAAKMSTRLVFPMVCCIWPGFFVVVVGPAILRMLEAFAG
ncbi:type II secretion system F family protein [Endozoicomonas atrinae]|uniref:type II secretion system F family protein n=1 Tax=Endozoicomonas atrinae TaxID=1333660 RepID=UPI0008261C88|nr:type II secretion system F family protein [Endozoicomonas atrinae]